MVQMREPPLGEPVRWSPVEPPQRAPLQGRFATLSPLDPAADAEPLYAASHPPHGDPSIWTYLPYGPYESAAHLESDLEDFAATDDPLFFTVETPEHGP